MGPKWIQRKKWKPKGLHEFVNRSLMALEEAATDSFQAREEDDTETWGNGDSCYEPAESKISEKDKL